MVVMGIVRRVRRIAANINVVGLVLAVSNPVTSIVNGSSTNSGWVVRRG